MKQIIVVDIDDVLADSTETARKMVNEICGVDLTRDHYLVPDDYWGYHDRLWQRHNLADRVNMADIERQMDIDQSHVGSHAHARRVLDELSKRYELDIITARNTTAEQATNVWLDAHFPGIFSRVIFGGQREDPNCKTKGDLCAELGAIWLIDDNVVHCTNAVNKGVEAILFGEYGWHIEVPENLQRCKDWIEVEKFISKH